MKIEMVNEELHHLLPQDASEEPHHHEHECDDPECECHEHNHHEEECDDPECECHEHHYHHHHHHQEKVRVSTHDSAIVGSVTCTVPFAYEEAVHRVEKKLHDVAEIVMEQGGFIGHVKGIVEGAAPQCRISITDESQADIQMFEPAAVSKTECVCIVFGVTKESLKNIITVSFSEWLEGGIE